MTYQALEIIGTLEQGISLDNRFGICLDSLLASVIREREKRNLGISGVELDGGVNLLMRDTVRIVELPIGKCYAGEDWHWLAGGAVVLDAQRNPLSHPQQQVNAYLQSEDQIAINDNTHNLPLNISPSSGRWKRNRIVLPIILGNYVRWYCYGDKNAIAELLDDVASIGAKRNQGEGAITNWEVKETSYDAMHCGHLQDENTLSRSVFQGCLEELPPIDPKRMQQSLVGYRPPYWHVGHRTQMWIPV